MVTRLCVPLAGFMGERGQRGYSYAERQADGQLHTGADLNIGAGDEDLGMPILAFADGVVEGVLEWDGRAYGFGNAIGVRHDLAPGVSLRGVYAHADRLAPFSVGESVAAGQELGRVGKSGGQRWAHVHFELRWVGFESLPLAYWGGRLSEADLSRMYADPYSFFRLLPAWNAMVDLADAAQAAAGAAVDPSVHAALQADREYNFRKMLAFEGQLRELEGRRRLKKGTVERLIAAVPA